MLLEHIARVRMIKSESFSYDHCWSYRLASQRHSKVKKIMKKWKYSKYSFLVDIFVISVQFYTS